MFNPASLAFLGDGVYELLVRKMILARHGSVSANKLHKLCVEYVKASAQAEAFTRLEPFLTEDELAIYRRGRNANGVSVPKSSTPRDYRMATGLEALFGYLYLSGESDRIEQLFNMLIEGESNHADSGEAVL